MVFLPSVDLFKEVSTSDTAVVQPNMSVADTELQEEEEGLRVQSQYGWRHWWGKFCYYRVKSHPKDVVIRTECWTAEQKRKSSAVMLNAYFSHSVCQEK